ncbi:MAG: hypothetical protein B7Y77_01930, partial [Bradyrhizobium sp. 35-63-5]
MTGVVNGGRDEGVVAVLLSALRRGVVTAGLALKRLTRPVGDGRGFPWPGAFPWQHEPKRLAVTA